MDRRRLINQIKAKGITVASDTLEILRELGSGGNGVTFLCRKGSNESIVAKVYIPLDARDLDETALKRFKNEISLISKIHHPNVIRAIDSGAIQLGAYVLPFYTMPLASGTLRGIIRTTNKTGDLESKLRIFVRSCLGVACLHSYGIIHRDLKPDNILLSQQRIPWVADLGIAHVNSEFAATHVQTEVNEKLRNQDYYAPEQRFGDATDVDHRADIYALGYILYELISGAPPVRVNSPKLQTIAEVYAPLDPIIDRMTAYDRNKRYSNLEDVIEDLSVAIGLVLARHSSGKRPVNVDLATMENLLKSSNEVNRAKGIEVARRLDEEALDILHEMLGHGRREVRNSVALALGEIGHDSSLPYLVGALYGNATNATRFRPSADTAARALALYDEARRLEACALINHPIRPTQILQILDGVSPERAFSIVSSFIQRGLLLISWEETALGILVTIDEERAWPEIKRLVETSSDFDISIKARRFISSLLPIHQVDFMKLWLDRGITDGWSFEYAIDMTTQLETDYTTKEALFSKLDQQIQEYRRGLKNREGLLMRIANAKKRLLESNQL